MATIGARLFIAAEANLPKTDVIHALEIETGKTVWTYSLVEGYVSSGLVCYESYLLIAQEYVLGNGIRPTDLIALNLENGLEVWRCALPAPRLAPAVVVGSGLFVAASSGLGFVVDAQTGRLKKTLENLPDLVGTRPFVHPTGIYISGHSAEIGRINPESWSCKSFFAMRDSKNWVIDITGNESLIIALNWSGELLAIDAINGHPIWRTLRDRGASSPLVVGEYIYLGMKRYHKQYGYGVAAFDLKDGRQIWWYGTEKHVEAPPLVVGNYVCVITRGGHLAVLEAGTGKAVWTADFDDRLYGAPLAVSPYLVVGKRSGEIVAFLWPEQGETVEIPQVAPPEFKSLSTSGQEQMNERPRTDMLDEPYEYDPRIKWERTAPLDLRPKMETYFTLSEVKNACFDLGINYEMLRGDHVGDKIRELIIACEKYQLVVDLLDHCRAVYPHVAWGRVAPPNNGDST